MVLKTPLLDTEASWKQRFRTPVVFKTALASANSTCGIAISNRASEVFQVYRWDRSTGELSQLTHKPAGLSAVVLSPDGRCLYYLEDQRGDETGHVVRIPYEGGDPVDLTPTLPPYVVSQESAAYGLTISGSSQWLGALVAHSNAFYLYLLEVGSKEIQEPRELYCSSHLAISPALSYAGEVAVIATTEHTGKLQYTLLAFDVDKGERLSELMDGPDASLEPIAFSPVPGDLRLLATSNQSGQTRPLLWNPRTGERRDLSLPELEGEVEPLGWSPDGRRILLCQFVQAAQRLYSYDLESDQLHALAHPSGTYGLSGTYFGPEGKIVAQWQDACHPNSVIELDGETGEQQRTLLAAGAVPEGRPWRSFTFPSIDGTQVQGWLCVPEGEGPFPTILETHGGPSAVEVETFDPICQAWVDHGFAYVSINYRGSTTFGKQFLEQIWGNPGELEVEDMIGARTWLIEQGIAKPDQILLTGWSYGGYLTLQALGKYPELWAGGIGGVAVADRALQYEYSSDKHKGYIAALFGGTPMEKPEQYRKSSPLTYVEQVKAPILLIQGRNDTRCPARQVEVYEEKMQALGKPIEILWFDAGHGSLAAEQSIAFQERMLRFAYQTLQQEEA